jgi:hypothetical protein
MSINEAYLLSHKRMSYFVTQVELVRGDVRSFVIVLLSKLQFFDFMYSQFYFLPSDFYVPV